MGVCTLVLAAPAPAQAVPVTTELALLIDVSGSVDSVEFDLQKTGYVNAFRDSGIQASIVNSGGIAATLIYWSSSNQQNQSVLWTLIDSVASAETFATLIENTSRPFSGLTAPGSALDFTVPLFSNNGFEGTRNVIDVSGDGEENDGTDTSDSRDAALAAGITVINGLAIGDQSITDFYVNNVQGGPGSFTATAATFADVQAAVTNKIGREVDPNPVPEPATLLLVGMGLAGLALTRRRQGAAAR